MYAIGGSYPKLFIGIGLYEGGVWEIVPKMSCIILFEIVAISVILVNFIEFKHLYKVSNPNGNQWLFSEPLVIDIYFHLQKCLK